MQALHALPVAQVQSFDIQQLKWSIEAVSRRVPWSNCLVVAVAGTRLLRANGYPAEFKLGVAKPDGRFDAHAWVELYGRVVLSGANSADHFTSFETEHRDVG